MKEQARARARQLAQEFVQRGDATGWFETLYMQAQGNEQAIHWADMEVNPNLVGWLDRRSAQGKGKLALVVGCGLGDDAEELAHRGFEVVAFDIAPTAIAWCRKRFPHSPVEYVVVDVFDPPSAWQGSFDFVLEAYTLQVLPADVRGKAMACIAGLLAEEGTLLVICRGRSPQDPSGEMPWPLTTEELMCSRAPGFGKCNVKTISTRKSHQRGDSVSSISELHPLKTEMGDPLAAGDSLHDIIPLRDAKKARSSS